MGTKIRLIIMNFLQFAVWGAYLTSMGNYLARVGMAENIGWFYSMQGVVSIFMPALIGIIADRWVPAQRMLGICHLLAAGFMAAAGAYGITAGTDVEFTQLFTLYSLSVAFYMPTLALSNSVAYSVLGKAGLDTVKHFPPIRVFGTIGFICAMFGTDLVRATFGGEVLSVQATPYQFFFSAAFGLILAVYAFTLPNIEVDRSKEKKGIVETLGLNAFSLFKQKKMALFFIFSMLLGVSLQITNSYANPFISSFGALPEVFGDTFGVQHPNILISISQISETLCILLIPFCLRRFGIKKVMLMAMFAWVLRFGLFGAGDPGFPGVILFILSMIVYGIAFDFFNISGSLFVDNETDKSIRSSAQGLFSMMTNGVGATIGTLSAQAIVNHFVYSQATPEGQIAGWSTAWYIFAGYALVVGVLFALVFKYKHDPEKVKGV